MGVLHPDYLLQELNAEQLADWEAYFTLDPFGNDRDDLRIAQLCCLFANANRDSKKHPRAYKLDEFMFDFGKQYKETKQQSMEDMKQILRGLTKRK